MEDWWEKEPWITIMASKRNGVLYVGVTAQLLDRVSNHKQNLVDGFTKKYGVHMLVYYENARAFTGCIPA